MDFSFFEQLTKSDLELIYRFLNAFNQCPDKVRKGILCKIKIKIKEMENE